MIVLYDSKTENFKNNGIGILSDTISCYVNEELNSNFDLEMEYKLDGKYVDFLSKQQIIKCPAGMSEDQLFRIERVEQDLDRIYIFANHISYDAIDNIVIDTNIVQKSGLNAIEWLFQHTSYENKFEVFSDISKVASARYVRLNPLQCLIGDRENSFVNRWGGEIVRNNFKISMLASRGNDTGYKIKKGKNVTGLKFTDDDSEIVTRILPKAFNGIFLPELFVDSPLIHSFPHPKIREIEFADIKLIEDSGDNEEDGYETEEELFVALRKAAKAKFSEEKIDQSIVNLKVDFIELSGTKEYEKYKNLEKLKMGDIVTVNIDDYDAKLKVVKTKFDSLKEEWVSLELGDTLQNYVSSNKNTTNTIIKQIETESVSVLQEAKKNATDLVNHPFNGCLFISEETGELFIADTNDLATAQCVWKWGLGGLAFSENGVSGPYKTAWTQDGKFVANFITTGEMSLQRISGLVDTLNGINTAIELNQNNITSIVGSVESLNNNVLENFTKIFQDIENIINSVQHSGGDNLLLNSVMFATNNDGTPKNWDISGAGSITIGASGEAVANGGLSGHAFKLQDKIVKQRIVVKLDDNSIGENEKTYYSFSTRIKKGNVGSCYVKIYNSKEEHKIEIPAGQSSYWQEFQLTGLLPKETYYYVEFYGSSDSDATFTDNIFSLGNYPTKWCQANGEIMNTQVNIDINGVLVKSAIYEGNYTVMSPLEFAGYAKVDGVITKVFTINQDTTIVKKLESEDEIKMEPIKIVPVLSGPKKGWHFVKSS